jgi:hypothetical protein
MNDEVVRKLARFAFAEGVEAGVAQVRPAPDWRSTEGYRSRYRNCASLGTQNLTPWLKARL